MLKFPSSHFPIRVNRPLDILLYILHLSALVVYGNGTEGERFKDLLDVGLGAACDAYVQVRKLRVDKVFQKP